MLKENEQSTINGTKYQSNFAFRFVGLLISHDKRFFETLQHQLYEWMPYLLLHDNFDAKEEREAFFGLMEVLSDLSDSTNKLNDDQLDSEFKEVLKIMGFQKESEVQHA